MEILQSFFTFIPKFLGGMTGLCVLLLLAASWVTSIVFTLFGNKFVTAFLCFIIPPFGIVYAWKQIYDEESLKRRLKG